MNEPAPTRADSPLFPGALAVEFAGHPLHMLSDRALWWPARRSLIVADVHLGKGSAFRALGVPVPAGSTPRDLARLDALLAMTAAARLIVLGDLVHARCSHEPGLLEMVRTWRSAHGGVDMLLVRGNHDRRAGPLPAEWSIREVEEPRDDGGLVFSHEPRSDARGGVLCGHLHPVYPLADFDGTRVRVPCFAFDPPHCAVLPAFGTFTGGSTVRRITGRQIFLAAKGRVVKCGEG